MEEARRVRHPPLTVQRDFANSRLEESILARVYELAVPMPRQSPCQPPTRRATAEPDQHETKTQKIAQGA